MENISAHIGPIQQIVGPLIAPRRPAGPVRPSNNSTSGGLAAHESHQAVQAADSQTHAHHHYGPRLGDGVGDGAGEEQIQRSLVPGVFASPRNWPPGAYTPMSSSQDFKSDE